MKKLIAAAGFLFFYHSVHAADSGLCRHTIQLAQANLVQIQAAYNKGEATPAALQQAKTRLYEAEIEGAKFCDSGAAEQ